MKVKTKKQLSAIRRAAVNKRWAKPEARQHASETTRAAYAALRREQKMNIVIQKQEIGRK
jgi:hypothetical protein